MPKRYLGSRSDKAIGYTVRKYCTYSVGLHQSQNLLCTAERFYHDLVSLPPVAAYVMWNAMVRYVVFDSHCCTSYPFPVYFLPTSSMNFPRMVYG